VISGEFSLLISDLKQQQRIYFEERRRDARWIFFVFSLKQN
jgi:hypothetical protein